MLEEKINEIEFPTCGNATVMSYTESTGVPNTVYPSVLTSEAPVSAGKEPLGYPPGYA
jgi:hypothetical protein